MADTLAVLWAGAGLSRRRRLAIPHITVPRMGAGSILSRLGFSIMAGAASGLAIFVYGVLENRRPQARVRSDLSCAIAYDACRN